MKSKLRKPLPKKIIAQIVRDSFTSATEIRQIRQMKEGYFNLVYLLVLKNPDIETVLKISPPAKARVLTCEQNLIQTELGVNRLLKEKTNLPVPEIITYNFNRNIIERDYIFFQKFSGQTLDKVKRKLKVNEYENIKETLGGYAAEIHSVRGEYFGNFNASKEQWKYCWKETFLGLVHDILNDGLEFGAVFPVSPQAISTIFDKYAHYLDDVREPELTYVDLREGNILVDKDNNGSYFIEGIIDADRAFWGDPCYDFISSIALFKDIRNEQSFLRGYGLKRDAPDFSRSLRSRLYMYRVYYDLQVIVERRSRQYPIIFSFLLWLYVSWHLKHSLKSLQRTG